MEAKLKKFRVYAPPDVKSYGLNEDGTLTITGIASTTNKDLDGDIVTPEALKSLARQVIGLNLHLDHNHHYDGGIGVITDAELESNSLRITAKILPEYAKGIQERLELGMNFGFSIGGLPIVSSMNHNEINDFILLEMSLTLLPANWDTFGTVESKGVVKSKCLTGACHYILKDIKKEKMVDNMEKDKPLEISPEIKQELVDIVNEAVYNLKPQLLEELKGDISTIVEDVVTQTVANVMPVDKDLDEEIDESSADEIVDEPETEEVADEIIDEPETEEEFEEKEASTEEEDESEAEVDVEAAEEVADEDDDDVETKSEDDDVIEDEPATTEEAETETTIEEEDEVVVDDEEVEEKDVTGVEEEAEVEYVESSGAPKVIVDVKELTKDLSKQILKELDLKSLTDEITKNVEDGVFKKLDAQRKQKTIGSKDSKLKQFQQKKSSTSESFLGSDKRDLQGRNLKYL
ncbi:MAG: hypothetical protein IJH63_00305 [Methanobrevibacter sp.]|nr:hypothetical protein [Methanosphaera sp.]MBR0369145.1 hypothetical protein [Methanobrevibacter sp.]